ncbi:M4 family metallopeptidase [Enterovibrio sp. 27052020O]|uniref:M4 family metallopeptidase n=1 Tax=Enterovibrio sp. 27052020O TaxID=3241166 RepID=UPI00388FF5BD
MMFNWRRVVTFSLALVPAAAIYGATIEHVSGNSPLLSDAQPVARSYSANQTPFSGFVPVETVVLPNGKVKSKHQQYYQGLPVRKGRIVSDKSGGGYSNALGKHVVGLSQSLPQVTPSLSHQGAKQRLKDRQLLSPPFVDVAIPEDEASELFVWLDKNNTPYLAYEVSFFVPTQKPTRPHAYIDAKTGEILKMWEGLAHAADIGQGPGGNTKTGLYDYGDDYAGLSIDKVGNTCTLENANVKTVNLNHGTSGSTAFSYTCNDSSNINTHKSINGAYSPLNDAHFFGQLVFDMYNDWLSMAPLSFQLVMRVHYGNNYENAFWNGASMTFGDGYSTFYPLVDVNVSAHEVSHGFTDQNSDLIYSGMSGGINEAFSDIAGEAAEYYWKGSVDWVVGADIFKSGSGLRYFVTPSNDGRSIDHASEYYPGLDVHYSSGVFNRAFYLLATTSGWDVRKAFEAFAFANKLYWEANSNFDDGGCGVVRAADDLGYNTSDVVNAFEQVGVYACLDAVELSDETPVANISGGAGSQTYFYFSLPTNTDNATVTLSGGSGNADLYVKYNGWPSPSDYDCVAAGASNDEVCDVTLQGSGEYNVLVVGDSSYSGATIELDVNVTPPQTLAVGDTVLSLSGSRGDMLFYIFSIPEDGSDLDVRIAGGSGDADLYLNLGSAPSQSDFDCRPYYYGNNETCTASGDVGDTFYVMLHGYSDFAGVALSLQKSAPPLPPEQRADPIDPAIPVTNLQGSPGAAIYYSFTVTSAGVLASNRATPNASGFSAGGVTISLAGGIGDADLYVRAGEAPTTAEYDCRSSSSSNQESCLLSGLSAGTYYVMIYGVQAFEGATLSMSETSSQPSVDSGGGGGGNAFFLSFFAAILLLSSKAMSRKNQRVDTIRQSSPSGCSVGEAIARS